MVTVGFMLCAFRATQRKSPKFNSSVWEMVELVFCQSLLVPHCGCYIR